MLKYQISWKYVQLKPGKADMMKLTVTFWNFVNAPIMCNTSMYTVILMGLYLTQVKTKLSDM